MAAKAALVIVEGARLPAGTVVEVLGQASLARMGGEHLAQRYRLTAVPRMFQTSCGFAGGTSAMKTAVWELSVFDDPGGVELDRAVAKLMEMRDQRRAEWLERWKSVRQEWEETPDAHPPLRLYRAIGRTTLIVAWAEGRFWEWSFQGFVEGGTAFTDGNLPGAVLYGGDKGETAGFREGLTAYEIGFRPFYVTVP